MKRTLKMLALRLLHSRHIRYAKELKSIALDRGEERTCRREAIFELIRIAGIEVYDDTQTVEDFGAALLALGLDKQPKPKRQEHSKAYRIAAELLSRKGERGLVVLRALRG